MSRPLRVYGDDFKHYISKFGRSHDLLNEVIAVNFCRIWGIETPGYAYIKLLPEHIPSGLNKRHYANLGFGSEYLDHAQELSQFLLTWRGNNYELGRIVNKEDILKIGLFDLWISNEDRNHNNANLLIQPQLDGFHFVAIDHVNIFNTNTLDKGLVCLTEESSILYSDYIPMLFKPSEKLQLAIAGLENHFRKATHECNKSLKKVLKEVPEEWGIDLDGITSLMQQLFKNEWKQEIIANFKLYIAKNYT
jgi:hypothetical protein